MHARRQGRRVVLGQKRVTDAFKNSAKNLCNIFSDYGLHCTCCGVALGSKEPRSQEACGGSSSPRNMAGRLFFCLPDCDLGLRQILNQTETELWKVLLHPIPTANQTRL